MSKASVGLCSLDAKFGYSFGIFEEGKRVAVEHRTMAIASWAKRLPPMIVIIDDSMFGLMKAAINW